LFRIVLIRVFGRTAWGFQHVTHSHFKHLRPACRERWPNQKLTPGLSCNLDRLVASAQHRRDTSDRYYAISRYESCVPQQQFRPCVLLVLPCGALQSRDLSCCGVWSSSIFRRCQSSIGADFFGGHGGGQTAQESTWGN